VNSTASPVENATWSNGTVLLVLTVCSTRIMYCVKAAFDGTANYRGCEGYLVITIGVRPFGVLLEVSPTEFGFASTVQLNATVIDLFTNKKYNGTQAMNITFIRVGSDNNTATVNTTTTTTAQAIINTPYPSNPNVAYGYMARLEPAFSDDFIPQGVVSNPVHLTVSNITTLSVNATRSNSTAPKIRFH
jgi:hypothetical protein